MHADALAASMRRIAKRAIVETVETQGLQLKACGIRSYDMRPALDESFNCPEIIDTIREEICAGIDAGLLKPVDPHESYVVRIIWCDDLGPNPHASKGAQL